MQTRYGVNLFLLNRLGSEWKISSMCWDDYEDQRLFGVNLSEPMYSNMFNADVGHRCNEGD
jgi:hypothetical protein